MDGKQTRPETRSQTANKLTEAELEIIQKRVLEQQERINAEMKALRVEREKFEKGRELTNQAINQRKKNCNKRRQNASVGSIWPLLVTKCRPYKS
jgi:hypothetical protein